MARPIAMDRKKPVAAPDLFVLIDREFRRRKARECSACALQLPYRVDHAHANWEMIAPGDCGRGCIAAFEELLREFQTLYELKTASD